MKTGAWRLKNRGENPNEIIPWSSRSPRTKEEVYAVRMTEQQILEQKLHGAPEMVAALGIVGGVSAYKIAGTTTLATIAEILEIPALLTLSGLKLAFLVSGGVLTFGSLLLISYYVNATRTEDLRLARAEMDISNLEQLQAEITAKANDKGDPYNLFK